MSKILCVLYEDPVGGQPKSYPRDDIPKLERYPDGQSVPSPERIDFKPGELLGSVSGELGLRRFVEGFGHTFIVTSDKDGADVRLHYTDRHRLAKNVEQELDVTYHPTLESLVQVCDVVTINCPLHPETEHLFNDALIAKMKRGAYLVNTARGKICDRDAVVRALESGQLAGYAGDVWFPQPAPKDHPWRTMPYHGMTPHVSGTTLSAQARYAAGVREILECWFSGRPIRDEYLIVKGGRLAGAGAHSYSAGNVTAGSEEASRYKE